MGGHAGGCVQVSQSVPSQVSYDQFDLSENVASLTFSLFWWMRSSMKGVIMITKT